MPYSKAEASRSLEVTEVAPPIPWWILALVGGLGGIIIISGAVLYEELRKKNEAYWRLFYNRL